MALAFSSLTTSEQLSLQNFARNVRQFMAQLARTAELGQGVTDGWNGGISALVSTVGPTEVIPNTSAYIGTQDITVADLTAVMNYAIAISDADSEDPPAGTAGTCSYNSPVIRSYEVKFAGIGAGC